MEKEAALQMLTEPEDFTFKYLVIRSAGQLGYDIEDYQEAKKILELGLLGHPPEAEKFQMEELLQEITAKLDKKENLS